MRGLTIRAGAARPLLDALAAIRPEGVARGDYCRTGECAHCEVWVAGGDGREVSALACQRRPEPGMRVTRLSPHLEADLFG